MDLDQVGQPEIMVLFTESTGTTTTVTINFKLNNSMNLWTTFWL